MTIKESDFIVVLLPKCIRDTYWTIESTMDTSTEKCHVPSNHGLTTDRRHVS
jgi:hypothetical protein